MAVSQMPNLGRRHGAATASGTESVRVHELTRDVLNNFLDIIPSTEKERSMKRPVMGIGIVIVCASVPGMLHFFEKVRTVYALGLTGSAFSLGFGSALIVFSLLGRIAENGGEASHSEATR
jgi:hypothetical protein